MALRRRGLGTFVAVCTLIALTLYVLRDHVPRHGPLEPIPVKDLSPSTETSHPIHQLITEAEMEQDVILSKQSKSLTSAVEEYKKRYKLNPPPNFDKWFEFAQARNCQFIDEYDTIYHSLLPFWGINPTVIRGRAREALGFDNSLLGIFVRNGQVVTAAGGTEWQQSSTVGMMEAFVQHLPPMDLPFNIHDEPRVVVPHDDLSRLIAFATDHAIPASASRDNVKNAFSDLPADLSDGRRPYEVKTTRFNRYAHQATWTESRMSCSPDSPSRNLDESQMDDDISPFSFSDLEFVNNKTAYSDICLSPSLREHYGFFDRPNAFNIVHDLFPIFSQSKISSYQDILYPSPWYWSDKVPYDESKDYAWDSKTERLYWRGSTTGGFSRDGGWRRQHRQRFVETINALDNTTILVSSDTEPEEWALKEVPRQDYKHLIDVHFAHVGQCDPGDCDAQKEYFDVVGFAKQSDAWQYKYLLDIDGNAFSGRFYAFLKSMSLVYKVAIFREWHEEWLRPWAHYVPLSLRGKEYLESVRYFHEEEEGREQAARLAQKGREWANQVLRKEDYEVWLFRLLLEYARVIDDDREHIGFSI